MHQCINGDDPGVAAGTVIGSSIFGLPSWNGLTAPFGTLVGQWGAGNYFAIGTAYTGVALDNTLKLFYFDSPGFNIDNSGSVLATVTTTPVPEPEAYAMFMLGLVLACWVS
jgi:PEP-CTERM motif